MSTPQGPEATLDLSRASAQDINAALRHYRGWRLAFDTTGPETSASPYVDGVLPGSVAEAMRRYAQARQEPTPGQERRWRLYDQALIAEHDAQAHQDTP